MLRLPELPADQRPTNRLFRLGAAALTDAELVAILLTTGTRHHDVLTHAQQLLHQIGGIAGLTRRHPEHLVKIDGLSTTKAARLLAPSPYPPAPTTPKQPPSEAPRTSYPSYDHHLTCCATNDSSLPSATDEPA
jgi:UPF0758 N-terminal